MDLIDYFMNLFGGLFYLFSPTFRERKNKEWARKSQMYKIYEMGMWIFMPILSVFLAVIILAKVFMNIDS